MRGRIHHVCESTAALGAEGGGHMGEQRLDGVEAPLGFNPMSLTRVVSGGQTGVDRGALDAALAVNFPCGGWCPPGRMAEDGSIPERYPLDEMPSGGYRQRTIRNVQDSDATLILYFGVLQGGTEQTMLHCIKQKRPYKLIDAEEIAPSRAARIASEFVLQHRIAVLNVAGPRQSHNPTAHAYALATVARLLALQSALRNPEA